MLVIVILVINAGALVSSGDGDIGDAGASFLSGDGVIGDAGA